MLKNHPYVMKSSLAAVAILVVVAGVHAGSGVWWKNIQRSFGAPGGMVRLENLTDGAAIHCESNGGNAIEAVGPVDISVASGPPMFVSSSDRVTNLNADQLDGLSSGAFARQGSYSLPPGGGTVTVDFPHHRTCHLVIGEAQGTPDEIAFIYFIENDARVTYMGFDGSGTLVQGTEFLSGTSSLLTLVGGAISLDCPGDGSTTLKINSSRELKAHLVVPNF